MSKAISDVAAERLRQVQDDGWDAAHDDDHSDGSLASVAACYALPPQKRLYSVQAFERDVGRSAGETIIVHDRVNVPLLWPQSWHGAAWRARERRRELVIAGALIIAEIERIDRTGTDPACLPPTTRGDES